MRLVQLSLVKEDRRVIGNMKIKNKISYIKTEYESIGETEEGEVKGKWKMEKRKREKGIKGKRIKDKG